MSIDETREAAALAWEDRPLDSAVRFGDLLIWIDEGAEGWRIHTTLRTFVVAPRGASLAEAKTRAEKVIGTISPPHAPAPESPPGVLGEEPLRRCDNPAQAWQEVREGLAREQELHRLLAIVETDSEGVWRWQGDGYDHPAALSCPVVMSADTLRTFVAARAEAAALREQVDRTEEILAGWRTAHPAIDAALAALAREPTAEKCEVHHVNAGQPCAHKAAESPEPTPDARWDEVQAIRARRGGR